METTSALPDRPTITVAEAAELLGISKDSAYAAARSGDLPVLRLGRRYLVSVPKLRTLLGIDEVRTT
jgi:excisionase family DNA binding protein